MKFKIRKVWKFEEGGTTSVLKSAPGFPVFSIGTSNPTGSTEIISNLTVMVRYKDV